MVSALVFGLQPGSGREPGTATYDDASSWSEPYRPKNGSGSTHTNPYTNSANNGARGNGTTNIG